MFKDIRAQGTAIYGLYTGMCRGEGYILQAVYSGIGYIKSESLGLE